MIKYHVSCICLTTGAGELSVGNGDSLPDNTGSWEEHRHKIMAISLNLRYSSVYYILCPVFLYHI